MPAFARPESRASIGKARKKKGKTMSPAKDPELNSATNGDTAEVANVDKIRDILFGSQMRDYEKRFARMEDRLAKDAAALREDLKKRFDALESFAKQEIESVGQ